MNRLLVIKLGVGKDRHLDADEIVSEVAAELAWTKSDFAEEV